MGKRGLHYNGKKYRLTCRKSERDRHRERERDRHATIETMQRPQHEATRTIAMRQLIFYA